MCSAGTSGMIFEDDNVVIGSPGPLNWRGAITIFNIAEDFFGRDKGTYTVPDAISETIKKDSYLGIYWRFVRNVQLCEHKVNIYRYLHFAGMSVTAGYFIGDNITVFVAGAPRGNETGQVVLFVKQISKRIADTNWKEYLIINGEQIASNFGYQVATADVNGDKYVSKIISIRT